MAAIHQNFLIDLGTLLRERAVAAHDMAKRNPSEFQGGVAHGYYEVLSLIESQAEAFGLPLDDIGLKGFSVDDELLVLGENHVPGNS